MALDGKVNLGYSSERFLCVEQGLIVPRFKSSTQGRF